MTHAAVLAMKERFHNLENDTPDRNQQESNWPGALACTNTQRDLVAPGREHALENFTAARTLAGALNASTERNPN